jgi:hypothetical protein
MNSENSIATDPAHVSSMSLTHAQQDMRQAHFGGATGMLTSACVWFVAAYVAATGTAQQALWTLFIGGALISPISTVFSKVLGRSGKQAGNNPLLNLAMASTFWLIFMLPLVYVVAQYRMTWFFPAMLLVIGGRYLTFSTLFGTRIYWLCGGALALAGYGLARMDAEPALAALCGALIETAFATAIFMSERKRVKP